MWTAPFIRMSASGQAWTRVRDLDMHMIGSRVCVRGRVHEKLLLPDMVVLIMRQSISRVFCVVPASTAASSAASVELYALASTVPVESVVALRGGVTAHTDAKLSAEAQALLAAGAGLDAPVSIVVHAMTVVAPCVASLPFTVSDACRTEAEIEERDIALRAAERSGAPLPTEFPLIPLDTRLDYRHLDLRTPANQAIMRIQAGTCQLFREFLFAQDFTEMHMPKILAGAASSTTFPVDYFGEEACLSSSSMMYKTQLAGCADIERVFEIGVVFRAEEITTHRHLTEMYSLEIEMALYDGLEEFFTLLSALFEYTLKGMQRRYAREIAVVRAQFPFEDVALRFPLVRIAFSDAVGMLRESGIDVAPDDDFSIAQERALGAIVKARYGTDIYIVDKYPSYLRPFYCMLDGSDPSRNTTHSFDLFLRGEEVMSGMQRVNDPHMLSQRAVECGMNVATIQPYIDSLMHGMVPSGGGGLGIARFVMQFLGLPDIRMVAMYPRDTKRLAP